MVSVLSGMHVGLHMLLLCMLSSRVIFFAELNCAVFCPCCDQ